jgi:hypothetical protein
MKVNSVVIFLKLVTSVKGGHCEYSACAPQSPATPLNTEGLFHVRLSVRLHTSSQNYQISHTFI